MQRLTLRLAAGALASVTIIALVAFDSGGPDHAGATATTTSTTAPSTTTTSPTSTTMSTTSTTSTTEQPADSFSGLPAAATYAASRAGTVEISIADLSTGTILDADADQPQIATASIVKVAIATALLQDAEQTGTPLSDNDQATLEQMIEVSDNDAASQLWHEVGGSARLAQLFTDAGMTDTTAGTGDLWGMTMTTAHDQALLLTELASGTLLNDNDTAYVLDLMRSVTPSQRWGIAAGIGDGDDAAVKNGWYEDDDGHWRVNCLAILDGPTYATPIAIAVLTRYDAALGMSYGEATCAGVAHALVG